MERAPRHYHLPPQHARPTHHCCHRRRLHPHREPGRPTPASVSSEAVAVPSRARALPLRVREQHGCTEQATRTYKVPPYILPYPSSSRSHPLLPLVRCCAQHARSHALRRRRICPEPDHGGGARRRARALPLHAGARGTRQDAQPHPRPRHRGLCRGASVRALPPQRRPSSRAQQPA